MTKNIPDSFGFTFSITPMPGLTWPQLTALERKVESYAVDRELAIGGFFMQRDLWSLHRTLSPIDQVDFLNWIVDVPGVVAVDVSPLVPVKALPATISAGYLRLMPLELAVVGLTILHRLGHLKPQAYLDILGGFVRPLDTH